MSNDPKIIPLEEAEILRVRIRRAVAELYEVLYSAAEECIARAKEGDAGRRDVMTQSDVRAKADAVDAEVAKLLPYLPE